MTADQPAPVDEPAPVDQPSPVAQSSLADQPSPVGPGDTGRDELDLGDFAFPEHIGDVRRAVRIGVLRTGFAAACWLLLAAVLASAAWLVAGAVRSEPVATIILDGLQVAHPEYEISEGLYINFGSTTMELKIQPRGVIGGGELSLGSVEQPVIGDFTVQLGQPEATPIRQALIRAPQPKSATAKYLDSLPASVSASAVVAFTRPLESAAFDSFTSGADGQVGYHSAVFLTDPYTDQALISWPTPEVAEYVRWAKALNAGDDDILHQLDLPSSAQLRAVADAPRIRAFVLSQASIPELRKLLADPLIASVNVADVGFDVADQLPQN